MNDPLSELRQAAALTGGEKPPDLPDVPSELTEDVLYEITHADGSVATTNARSTTDSASDTQGYVKTVVHHLIQAACCGALLSHDKNSHYPAPAGICPSCSGYLCRRHLEQDSTCVTCDRVLCRRCRRVALARGGMVFCAEHLDGPGPSEESSEWLKSCQKALRDAGYVVR